MNKPVFCISIDFELLWGRRDKSNLDFFGKRIGKERIVVNRILSLFKKYDIPATWAVVGKLYENGNPNYCGTDVLKNIAQLKSQEIASHSYTHPVFTEISKEEAIVEFNKFKKKTFVFPRNKIKYIPELKKAGFKTYRGKDEYAQELLIPRVPPVYSPFKQDGLTNIPGSMYFVSGRGLKKYIPKNLRYFKCKLGIDNAIRQNKIFHIWFHPIDFVDDSIKIFSDFEKVLMYASSKRSKGLLDILTMKDIN
jgi:hypothetical protein